MIEDAIYLGPAKEIKDPGSRGYQVFSKDQGHDVFVVRQQGVFKAYANQCPHTGAPMEWLPHHFLDYDLLLIQCATHGALFRVDNGLCLRGPCLGQKLKPLVVLQQEGELWLERTVSR